MKVGVDLDGILFACDSAGTSEAIIVVDAAR